MSVRSARTQSSAARSGRRSGCNFLISLSTVRQPYWINTRCPRVLTALRHHRTPKTIAPCQAVAGEIPLPSGGRRPGGTPANHRRTSAGSRNCAKARCSGAVASKPSSRPSRARTLASTWSALTSRPRAWAKRRVRDARRASSCRSQSRRRRRGRRRGPMAGQWFNAEFSGGRSPLKGALLRSQIARRRLPVEIAGELRCTAASKGAGAQTPPRIPRTPARGSI